MAGPNDDPDPDKWQDWGEDEDLRIGQQGDDTENR